MLDICRVSCCASSCCASDSVCRLSTNFESEPGCCILRVVLSKTIVIRSSLNEPGMNSMMNTLLATGPYYEFLTWKFFIIWNSQIKMLIFITANYCRFCLNENFAGKTVDLKHDKMSKISKSFFPLTTWIVGLKGIWILKIKVFSKIKAIDNNEFNELQFSVMMKGMRVTEAYPWPPQTSKIESFATLVNC